MRVKATPVLSKRSSHYPRDLDHRCNVSPYLVRSVVSSPKSWKAKGLAPEAGYALGFESRANHFSIEGLADEASYYESSRVVSCLRRSTVL